MISLFLNLVSLGIVALLLAFTLRRLILLLTLLRPQLPITNYRITELPDILAFLPARNESASLPGLLHALDSLDYPRDRLRVVLINDGSTDDTAARMLDALKTRPHWRLHSLPQNLGKPAALNSALAAHDFGDLIYILDADHRPAPDCLKTIAAAFADGRVAGVSGQMRVDNPTASPAAYYTAVESLVNQFVTMRGKDVLRLGPALLGSNNAYRRSALNAVSGFRAGAYLEDSDLTLALQRAGYTTRYLPQAVSLHHAPASLAGYLKQHIRWGRGFNDVARAHLGEMLQDRRLAWPMRIELTFFALGYLDRLAVLAAIFLLIIYLFSPFTFHVLLFTTLLLNLTFPLMQILAALVYNHAPPALWVRLPLVPLFFMLDIAVALYSALASLLNRPRLWYQTERA